MKVTLTSTTKIVTLDGVPARVWEGTTERGVPVIAFVTRVAVDLDTDVAELAVFEAELAECRPPSPEAARWPSRLVL